MVSLINDHSSISPRGLVAASGKKTRMFGMNVVDMIKFGFPQKEIE